MAKRVFLLVGTNKGAFILESDFGRRTWSLRGPFCEFWPINYAVGDPHSGTIYCGGGNRWFGSGVWKSKDLGATWEKPNGLKFEDSGEKAKTVWSVAVDCSGLLYAGVEPAGLFRSNDNGHSWHEITGLQKHPSRPHWQPGGAGLILHSLVLHPHDPRQMWIGISAAGVFYTADGGESWHARNRGTRADFLPEDQRYPEFGQCVHCLVMANGMPNRLYQQNHCGMYRTDDAGESWESIEAGLPSTFGFPAAAHPRDPSTLYLLPLNGDSIGRYVPDGKAAVWRSRDGGTSWEALRRGLPQEAYFAVLRQAMTTDDLEPAGVYFGTNTGSIFASNDEGESWGSIAQHLPLILSVKTLVLDS